MVKDRPIPLHTWELDGSTLSPTACHLEEFNNRQCPEPDPLVTLRFEHLGKEAHIARELHVRASVLKFSSPPFQALVSSGFLESKTRLVHLEYASYTSFQYIVPFLNCEKIDLTTMPIYLPIHADRWGLDVLFDACFAFAETQSWPTFHSFMCFALPLMRLLQVPRTFKHVFAARISFRLDYVMDWIRGEEDCRTQRLPSTPATILDTKSNRSASAVRCPVHVDGAPCPCPAGVMLRRTFFRSEHYEIERQRYSATIEHFDTLNTSTAEIKQNPRGSAANVPSNQSMPQTNVVRLSQIRAPAETFSDKNYIDHNPLGNNVKLIKEKKVTSKKMTKAYGNTGACTLVPVSERKAVDTRANLVYSSSSPLDLYTPSFNTLQTRKGASWSRPCDMDNNKPTSLSPVTSDDGRRPLPLQKCLATGSSEKHSYNLRKRSEHPESADREYAFWDAMKVQKMLPRLLKKLVWFSSPGYAVFILKGVLYVLASELTEEEKIDLLRLLPWEREDFFEALHSNSPFSWRSSDWRIVAKAQSLAVYRKAGGGREYCLNIAWPGFVHEVCEQSSLSDKKHSHHAYINAENMSMLISLRTRDQDGGKFQPLLLKISNHEPKEAEVLEEDLLERPLNVSVSVREMDCGCEAGSGMKMSIVPRMFYGLLLSDLKVRSLFAETGVTFTIMDDFEMSRWVRRHHPTCGLIVALRVRICDENQRDHARDSTDYSGERLGRGECPCGLCFEDETSDDEMRDADMYSDASDESESDSEVDGDEGDDDVNNNDIDDLEE